VARMVGKAADVKALGAIFARMLSDIGTDLYGSSRSYLSSEGIETLEEAVPESLNVIDGLHLQQLFSAMMHDDPERRPTAAAVFKYLRSRKCWLAMRWDMDAEDDPNIYSELCGECCL